jgi:hypothetical protein
MANFLTLAGWTPRCLQDTAKYQEVSRLGVRRRALDGTMLSTERTPRRRFQVQVLFQDAAEYAAENAAISVPGSPGIPTPVTASSDADGLLMGQSFNVWAVLGDAEPFQFGGSADTPEGVYWIATLEGEEE